MLRYMLDTSLVIYTVLKRPPLVRQKIEAHAGEICVSSLTAMELLYGVHKSPPIRRNLDLIEGLLDGLAILDFDLDAAEHAAQIRVELAVAATPIGSFDVMIAGQARSQGLCLVTKNQRAFTRISGLPLANWTG